MIVDTHCHLNFKAFKKDLDEVISRAKKAGVEKIIAPGAKAHSSRIAVEIAEKYEGIFAAVGIHPHHASENADISAIELLAKNNKTVAIGEIGLDHHQYKDFPEITESQKNIQVKLFQEQLKIAHAFKKPVIIHCREAQELIIKTLTAYIEKNGNLRGVFHCFEGTHEYLKKVIEMGFYIGFDGNITYPENNNLMELIKDVPENKLLLETDAPFLTPQKYRGSRNEPAFLAESLDFLSGRLGTKRARLEKITSDNADLLFFSK